MRLPHSRRADYAVRATLALAESGRLLTAGELARRMAIPPGFLPQILPGLVRSGILVRSLGRHGGYVLAREAGDISLFDVIEAADAAPLPRTCVMRGGGCHRDQPCAVHEAVTGAEDAMRLALSGRTIASLLERRPPEGVRVAGG